FAAAWGAELPSEPGLTVVEMIHAAARGQLRAIYVMGENPMLSDPDITHVGEALDKLEFLAVQDIFLSETARKADFKRPLNLNGAGATRMRLFSSKLSGTSLAAMERQINEWLDTEKVEIKAVSSEIGAMQDKTKEDNLILCVWY
ncbi:MAG: molybdopterin-dependent oxidoreductase, partial [Planctomycetota bacterium]|nr:molybdopterin-dependent oxidoreductase [Planctomycetota bacterium]